MASTPTRLMTFAEFEPLPDPKGGRHELDHGKLIEVARPKLVTSDVSAAFGN